MKKSSHPMPTRSSRNSSGICLTCSKTRICAARIFWRDNTVIAKIVDHIFAPSNPRDRPDKRCSFVGSDLPLGGMDFAHASKQAQDAMRIIDLDPTAYLPLAIEVINRNLDRAVARTLSFSGDRVEELMSRLRIYLKEARQGTCPASRGICASPGHRSGVASGDYHPRRSKPL